MIRKRGARAPSYFQRAEDWFAKGQTEPGHPLTDGYRQKARDLIAPSLTKADLIIALATPSTGSPAEGERRDTAMVPDGWALVPIKADAKMEKAALKKVAPYHDMSEDEWCSDLPKDLFRLAWSAMIAAAPVPATDVEGEGRRG